MPARDTTVEADEAMFDHWRSLTPLQRLEIADQLSRDVDELARIGIRANHPGISAEDEDFELLRRKYGDEIAAASRRA